MTRALTPPDWTVDALCTQTGPDDHTWFPDKGGTTQDAKQLCNGRPGTPPCPVREQCLAYALTNHERYGVWGGKSERERRALRTTTTHPTREQEGEAA